MKTRRFLALLLCVILSLGLLPLAAGAETIDTGRDCALTVDFWTMAYPLRAFPLPFTMWQAWMLREPSRRRGTFRSTCADR